jgi:hypothetical protein
VTPAEVAEPWHAACTRWPGWSHASHISGGLASKPFGVATAPGSGSAFWVGRDHRLSHAASSRGTGWSRASPLAAGQDRRGSVRRGPAKWHYRRALVRAR